MRIPHGPSGMEGGLSGCTRGDRADGGRWSLRRPVERRRGAPIVIGARGTVLDGQAAGAALGGLCLALLASCLLIVSIDSMTDTVDAETGYDFVLETSMPGFRDYYGMALSPDSSRVCVFTRDTVYIIDVETMTTVLQRTIDDARVTCGCWIDDSLYLGTYDELEGTSAHYTLRVLSSSDLSDVTWATPTRYPPRSMAASPDGTRIALLESETVHILDSTNLTEVAEYPNVTNPRFDSIVELEWDPSGSALAAAGDNIFICELGKAKPREIYIIGFGSVGLFWSPDGSLIYSLDYSATALRVVTVADGKTIEWKELGDRSKAGAILFERNDICVGDDEGDLRVLSLDTMGEHYLDANATDDIRDIVWGWGGYRILTFARDGVLREYLDRNDGRYNWPPSVSVIVPAEGETVAGTFTAAGTVTDDGRVLAALGRLNDGEWMLLDDAAGWTMPVPSPRLKDGANTITIKATDGEKETERTVSFLYVPGSASDPAPRVLILSPANGSTVGEFIEVRGIASDDVEVTGVWVRVGPGLWSRASGTTSWTVGLLLTSYRGGWAAIEARSSDVTSDSLVATVSVFVDPTEAPGPARPSVAVERPRENDTVVIDLRCSGTTLGGSAITRTYVSFDGRAWEPISDEPVWQRTYVPERLPVGRGPVSFLAHDGQTPSRVVQVNVTRIDYEGPVVSIDSPAPRSTFTTDLSVSGTVSRGYGEVQRVMASVNGGEWTTAVGGRAWSLHGGAGDLPFGETVVEVRAEDAYATSAVQAIVLLHGRPLELVIEGPTPGTVFSGSISVHGRVENGLPGALVLEVSKNGRPWVSMGNASRNWTIDVGADGLVPGDVLIEVRAFDGASYSGIGNVTVVYSPDLHVVDRAPLVLAIALVVSVCGALAVALMARRKRG